MGRIFEKRKDRMFARWAKNAKAFTKVGKEIAVAVKLGGAEPSSNPRLRLAIQTARSLNMPKDRIEAAIERASSKDESDVEEVVYDAYGPHGIAIVIETATNNPTRTVANVRAILARKGGSLGSAGSLDYLFDRKGVFVIDAPNQNSEELELELIDAGVDDIENEDGSMTLYCSFDDFGAVQLKLEELKAEVKNAGLHRYPGNYIELSEEQQAEVEILIEALEEDDDVQHVYHNMG